MADKEELPSRHFPQIEGISIARVARRCTVSSPPYPEVLHDTFLETRRVEGD